MARTDIQDLQQWRALAQKSGYRVRSLAKELSVSQRQLQRYTIEVFGKSPQGWLDQERMIMSAGLLRKYRSVKLVAFQIGFKQVSHFCREFKLYYGLSATAFLVESDRERRGAKSEESSPNKVQSILNVHYR